MRYAKKQHVRLAPWQCQVQLEPSGHPPDKGSHICRLKRSHVGPHKCAVCLGDWNDGDDSVSTLSVRADGDPK